MPCLALGMTFSFVCSLTENHIMLMGGRHWENNGTDWNRVWINSPEFFSLKPTCDGGALPSCLNGTKTAIDSQERRRPALIKTDGKECYKVTILQGNNLPLT